MARKSQPMRVREEADVIIIGGGPAGLSCALILGRCKRSVLVFDDGRYRNYASTSLNGFITRDGTPPAEFLRLSREDCKKYGVEIVNTRATELNQHESGFTVITSEGKRFACKKVVLATGLEDELPPIAGIGAYYGRSVFHCPFCDGCEHAGEHWAVFAKRPEAAVETCLRYLSWTPHVTLLAHGMHLPVAARRKLAANGIQIADSPIVSLEGDDGKLQQILLADGSVVTASVLFFSVGSRQRSDLCDQIGCNRTARGVLNLNRLQQSSVRGLYIAGDMARDVQLSVIAAAEGAKAAVAIHIALNKEERR